MAEPVSLALAKAQCGILDDTTWDTLIGSYIPAARDYVETEAGRVLELREFTTVFDRFTRFLELPHRPVITVTEVAYVDAEGADQTYPDFIVTYRPPVRVYPAISGWWPSTQDNSEIIVTYTAGYADPAASEPGLVQAMLLLIGHWFANREAVVVGTASAEVQLAVKSLCDQKRPIL
jgi:uncharacterized phiE125 gp8 family phage protein